MKNANKEQVNRELAGYIQPGKCFHEHGIAYKCKHCDDIYDPLMEVNNNPDYFTKDGFWDVWEWFIINHTVIELIVWLRNKYGAQDSYITSNIVNYKTFARDVYEYLKGEK